MYAHMRTCIHANICIHIHAHSHTYKHAYRHTHKETRKYILTHVTTLYISPTHPHTFPRIPTHQIQERTFQSISTRQSKQGHRTCPHILAYTPTHSLTHQIPKRAFRGTAHVTATRAHHTHTLTHTLTPKPTHTPHTHFQTPNPKVRIPKYQHT